MEPANGAGYMKTGLLDISDTDKSQMPLNLAARLCCMANLPTHLKVHLA